LEKNIKEKIWPLYKQKMINAKITNTNFSHEGYHITVPSEPIGYIRPSDQVKDDIAFFAKDKTYNNYYPPIIKCFYNNYAEIAEIANPDLVTINKSAGINKPNLVKKYSECFSSIAKQLKYNKDIEFKNILNDLLNKINQGDNVLLDIYNIYKLCVRPFEKNIDYYALTKVICDLYYNSQITDNEIDNIVQELKFNFLSNNVTKENFETNFKKMLNVL
jgi:hypothetical protein